ncbi:MAG: TetR/AcrR family transcriptional regulator [Caulobacterales bacterium]|nr:TetR/AcrR family transcriptional regulator [Caulobacterales bacterium]
MPAIVDHDARRAALARIAADLIAEEGVEAATVRAIARAAGFSTKVVSHYFQDKRALLLMTYRFAAQDSVLAASDAARRSDGETYALSLLPTQPGMVRNWKVWLAFWGFAISDAAFAEEQRNQALAAAAQLAAILARDPRFGHLDETARGAAARNLITTVIGVAVQAAFDPKTWTPEVQAETVLARLAEWSSPA